MSNKTISVVVDEETDRWLRERAEKLNNMSVSLLVRSIIAEHRARVDKLPPLNPLLASSGEGL